MLEPDRSGSGPTEAICRRSPGDGELDDLGGATRATSWADIEPVFHTVASWFSDSTHYEFEVIAAGASGDLAYTVGYEHNQVKIDGRPRTYTVRVTHIYRREDGQWRIVHRHGDPPPAQDSPF